MSSEETPAQAEVVAATDAAVEDAFEGAAVKDGARADVVAAVLPRHITDYLKGIAIIAVLVNHYTIFYFQAGYAYAYGLMTFFFLLGGAGIHLSLQRDSDGAAAARPTANMPFLKFFLKRDIRIYPLYWLAYATAVIELMNLGGLDSFSATDLLTALIGFPTHPRGVYWFVTAIIECYMAAPLLFLIIRRYGVRSSLGLAFVITAASLMLTPVSTSLLGEGSLTFDMLSYKGLFLGNVVLFFLGMLIPQLVAEYRQTLGKTALWTGTGAAFIFLIFATDRPGILFGGSELVLAPFLFLCAFVFCVSLISARPWLPLNRPLAFAGNTSYPLYLFHQPLLFALAAAGLITENSYTSVAVTLLVFPFFLAACYLLQRANGLLRSGLERRWSAA